MITIFQWLLLTVIPITIWGLSDTWYIWWCHHFFTIFFQKSTLLNSSSNCSDLISVTIKKIKYKTQSDKLFGLTRLWSSVLQLVSQGLCLFLFSISATYQREMFMKLRPFTEFTVWIYSYARLKLNWFLFHSWCIKRYPHLLEILFREPVKNYLADFFR